MSSAARYELLMNTDFVRGLHEGLAAASERICIQVMTFDGDAAGLGVSELLIDAAERGVDVRLTVDVFAFRYVSDVKVNSPLVADEVAETHAMFDRMEAAGVAVTYISPWGPLLMFGPFRNHKKVYVIDDVAYIGGINISDHNFEWLDFNIGFTEPSMVAAVVDDFEKTRAGERQALRGPIITNEHVEATFLELIEQATESVVVASPYALDVDLVKRLAAVSAGEKVVVAPRRNNFRMFRATDPYIRARLSRQGVELRTYTDFFHAKFALIDGTKLLVGSSNFGRHSFRCNQEIAVVIEDQDFITSFKSVLDRTEVHAETASPVQYAVGSLAAYFMYLGTMFIEKVFARHAPTLTSR
ncbi:MAG: cardiolipin synthase [Verrucomicrobiales bacterium]|jgi:cardiolipin synthase